MTRLRIFLFLFYTLILVGCSSRMNHDDEMMNEKLDQLDAEISYLKSLVLVDENLGDQNYLVKLASKRDSDIGGNFSNRGSIILYDNSTTAPRKISPIEIGFYNYGTGIFTDDRFEFWTGKSVSIANHKRTPNLEIRTSGVTLAGFWANGAGWIGTQLDELAIHVGSSNGDFHEASSSPSFPSPNLIISANGEIRLYGNVMINDVPLDEYILQNSALD